MSHTDPESNPITPRNLLGMKTDYGTTEINGRAYDVIPSAPAMAEADPCKVLTTTAAVLHGEPEPDPLAEAKVAADARYQETLDKLSPANQLLGRAHAGPGEVSLPEHQALMGDLTASLAERAEKRAAPKISVDEAASMVAQLLADAPSADRVDEMRKLQVRNPTLHRQVSDKLAHIGVSLGLREPDEGIDPAVLKARQDAYLASIGRPDTTAAADGIDAQTEIERVFKHRDRTAELQREMRETAVDRLLKDEEVYTKAMAELCEQLNRVVGFDVNFTETEALMNATEFLRRYAPDGHGKPAFGESAAPYEVIEARTIAELRARVSKAYAAGYVALGAPVVLPEPKDDPMSIDQPPGPFFAQAMVLK